MSITLFSDVDALSVMMNHTLKTGRHGDLLLLDYLCLKTIFPDVAEIESAEELGWCLWSWCHFESVPWFFFFTFETDKEILLYSPALSNIDQEGLILVTGLVKLWTYSNIFNLLKYKTRTMYQIFMLASLMVGFAGDWPPRRNSAVSKPSFCPKLFNCKTVQNSPWKEV